MSIFGDILSNVKTAASGTTNSITGAWKDLTDINSLGLPNFNFSNLLRTVSGINNTLNGFATKNTAPQNDVLYGLSEFMTGKKYIPKQDTKTNTSPNEYIDQVFNNGQSVKKKLDGVEENEMHKAVESTDFADRLNFQSADWTYADFINERAVWQKSLQNPLGEKGWFYFKIFFNFDTQYGLLGGLLNNEHPLMATNSAYKYLHACEALGKYYKCNDRQVALMKFAKILSYISTYAPWFFKGIKNLNQANIPVINDLTKERSIEIECTEDAIDMRLNTLLDLYKFACYDEIDQKEIVPDNLRKFDMTIVLFQAPLRYFHTSFKSGTHKYNYKGLSVNSSTGFSDTMSFKMYTFINCEIDIESLGNMVPGGMTNEQPFTVGGGSIKILYDRVYTHTMNEFMHIMFGNDGLYYDGSGSSDNLHDDMTKKKYSSQTELQRQRISDITKIHDDNLSNSSYRAIVDASEELCINNMRALGFNALGNFNSGGPEDPQITTNGTSIKLTDYFKLKHDLLGSRTSTEQGGLITSVPTNASNLTKELIESYNKTQATLRATWQESNKILYTDGRGFFKNNTQAKREGNMYWLMKLAQMKDGYCSPETLVERLGSQRYVYNNFTKSGYADKLVGSEYWKQKLNEMVDGKADPGNSVYNKS